MLSAPSLFLQKWYGEHDRRGFKAIGQASRKLKGKTPLKTTFCSKTPLKHRECYPHLVFSFRNGTGNTIGVVSKRLEQASPKLLGKTPIKQTFCSKTPLKHRECYPHLVFSFRNGTGNTIGVVSKRSDKRVES